ncbi:adenylate/guanylate cyclase domain-containing protein [Muricoccus nepalensis]|uniref:adenylate/guanylate cyclase domain-containing protein n=1 Tax=Muricoccus nepalensis TaxID=1854500 RepID=UPI0013874F60|nr:adenylate/guanylate cyclase domain-containing protein [Roseomonas nepalensis]
MALRAPAETAAPEAGERRPVTVLFADLVGSSALAARLDPEDLRDLLLAYREAAAAAVTGQGGSLSQHQGDGILARFGFPVAREDDAERALRAALGIARAVAALRARLGLALEVRVAVHSGIVVVATLGHGVASEPGAMVGEVTTVAARLQHAAGPGEVWVSEATRRLAPRRFRFAPRGEVALAGLPRPVLAHRLEDELPPGLAAPGPAAAGPPLVGREDELRGLFSAWRDAEAGAGTAVMIEAEPGHGKTRLFEEFRARIGAAGEAAVVVACSAGDEASAFRPLIAWLSAAAALPPRAAPDEARGALAAWLGRHGLAGTEHAAPLAVLLHCATPAEAAEMEAAGRRRRRRGMAAFLAALRAGAGPGTALFVAEDIHWADDSTLAVLRLLADACAARDAAMLLLLTRRPEGHGLPGAAPLTFRLHPLDDAAARRLAAAAAPQGADPALLAGIIARAGGVPIFLVEAARDAQADCALPLTLRAGLTARLDALPEAKPLAQLAAVIGRSFRGDMIAALAETVGLPSARRPLRRLVEVGLMEPEGPPEAPTGYTFRHELMRDMAYETLLRSRRATLHLALARLLPERFADLVDQRPELLARHLAAGGAAAEAVAAYERAAARAMRAGAHGEAAGHFRAALEQVPKLPGPVRDAAEARLQVGLAAQITVARGNAVPEVGEAFATAHAAALRLDDRQLLLRTLRGLQTFHLVRGSVREGHAIGERIMALMEGERDGAALLQAHRPFGLGLLYLGRYREARQHLERVLALYDPARDEPHRFDYGSDPAVLARAHLGWAHWFEGDAAAAFAADAAAVAAARGLDHAHSLCFALAFRCALAQFAGRGDECLAAAGELGAVAAGHDFAYWSAWAAILEGWARARRGERAAGEAMLRRGLEDYRAMGAGLLLPYALALLASLVLGEEGGALLTEAERLAEAGGIAFSESTVAAARAALAP